ncbi:membrane protein [Mesorhizobium sp. L-8-10]|nr:membrane protein [Mesorhizobium sp. L-8-10]
MPPPRPGPQPGFCTREYAPVCGERRGDRQTFANACLAGRAGYRIVSGGECRANGGPRPGICTREYAPVCARRGDRIRTFANECEAAAAGYRVIASGECRAPGGGAIGGGNGGNRVCTAEYVPVCARRGSNVRTFGNQCEADSAGYRVVAQGPC